MTASSADDSTPFEARPRDGLVQFVPPVGAAPLTPTEVDLATNHQLVLLGAGHAHLQILKWWSRRPLPNTQLILVSAFDRAAYSGMLSGALAGLFPFDEMLIDLPTLCRSCGVRLIVDRAVRLDPVARRIELAHQPALTFDVASINIGSVPAADVLCQMHRVLVSIKPMANFPQRFEMRLQELLHQHAEAGRTDLIPIAVVGGGAAGVELALCLEERGHREQWPLDVLLIEGGGGILAGFSESAVRTARKLLKRRGIDVHLGRRVAGCDEEGPASLIFDDGTRLPCELAIWATGAAPPAVLRGFELPKSPRGFLTVRPTLQSTADVPVFVVGDTADVFGDPVPKAGVYAVRQAPVLWRNLQRHLAGQPLQSYRPQRGFLSLLSCGDGTALLDYHGWSSHSRWAWWLKQWIDRRFVRQFQR